MSEAKLTANAKDALSRLQAAGGRSVELAIPVGSALVKAGVATHDKGSVGLRRGYSRYRAA